VRDDDVTETNGLAQLIENGLEMEVSAEYRRRRHPPTPRAAGAADYSNPDTDGGASDGGRERGLGRHV
jgi:hypothetical protein